MPGNAHTRVPRARKRRGSAARRDDGRDLRTAILDSTEALLAEHPLEELTVHEIIDAAGVSRASFYIYFESKNAAVATLAETVIQEIYDLWQPFMAGTEQPSAALLTEHWLETLALWRQHRAVLVAAAQAWRANPQSFYQWGALWQSYIRDTRAYIERVRADWNAPSDLDAGTLATMLIWLNESTLYMAFTDPSVEIAGDKQLARTMSAIWMRAIFGTQPFA
jgi:TetR/AcrR family transcriptional regulator, ethionamide resistance regulator